MKRAAFFVLALVAAGCMSEIREDQKWETLHEVVYAGISQDETKTSIDTKLTPMIRWSAGDEISVFASASNEQYRFNGKDGDSYAAFDHVSGSTDADIYSKAYAVYPYDESNSIKADTVRMCFPSMQTYAGDSFGKGAVPMVAVSKADSILKFQFKPLCGYLKLRLWNADGKSVKSITITAPGARLSGEANVVFDSAGTPVSAMVDTTTSSVTLNCGDGVALGTTEGEATSFWFALPPAIMEKGFSVAAVATDGSSFVKTTSKSRTIIRNVINSMDPIECEFVSTLVLKYETTEPGQTVKLFYSATIPKNAAGTDNTLVTIDYGDGTYGTDISHTYAEIGIHEVRMIYEKPVTELKQNAFVRCTNIIGVELPNTILKIGASAFLYCKLRGSLVIPSNNVEIGSKGLYLNNGCLDSLVIPHGTVLLDGAFRVKAKTVYLDCDIPDMSNSSAITWQNSIEKLIIGKDVEYLGERGLRNGSINEIEFEEGSVLNKIADLCFTSISGLKTIILPSSVTYISEDYLFANCPNLESIRGGNNDYWTEDGILYTRINGLKSVFRYPEAKDGDCYDDDSVEGLVMDAFRANNNLKNVRLGLKSSIPDYAFLLCSNLEVVEGCDFMLPKQSYSGKICIGDCSFRECSSLKEFTIGAAVDTIKSGAFFNCTELKALYCKSNTPPVLLDEYRSPNYFPTLGNHAPGRLIYVPKGCVETYKAASGWSNYESAIVSEDFELQGENLSAENGTANCYIVSDAGRYTFMTAKGNTEKSVGDVASAEVLWESFGTNVAPSVGDLVSDVSYKDGFITFTASDKKGNAVIAAKDASGNILWSWHIWMTDKPADQVYNNNAGTMMDRNLGATSSVPGDPLSLGLLYQWGRKDPFLGGCQISYSSSSNQQTAASTITWPSAVLSDADNGTIEYSLANPTTFIKRNSSNSDWYYTGTSSTNNSRWVSSKGLYDPCPAGYHVPSGSSSGIWSTAFGTSDAWTTDSNWDSANKGMDYGSTDKVLGLGMIWHPASGGLSYDSGALLDTGSYGYYWSCTSYSSGKNAYSFTFYSSGKTTPVFVSLRASGKSVRCQKIK